MKLLVKINYPFDSILTKLIIRENNLSVALQNERDSILTKEIHNKNLFKLDRIYALHK